MATIIQLRHDTKANWESVNPVLAQGEIGIETDTRKIKVGDGYHAWTSVEYTVDPTIIPVILDTFDNTSHDGMSGIAVAEAIADLQAATTAVKFDGEHSVGGSTTPVYVNENGEVVALTYSIAKSVPSNAEFTDTKNTAGSTDTAGKIFLIGATSQTGSSETFSHDTVFVDSDGRLNTAAPAVDANDNTAATTKWVKDQGYIKGINSSDVTTALGYTPYDSSNPAGYTTNEGTVTSVNNVEPVNGNVTIELPSPVTEETVAEWGFTKNEGTVTSINNITPVSGDVTLTAGDVGAYTKEEVNEFQRIFTFEDIGITKTTSSDSTIDLVKEIAGKDLATGTILFGEVRVNDMPPSLVNAEIRVEVLDRQGSKSVLKLALTSCNVEPYEWEFFWFGTSTSGTPSVCTWQPAVRADSVLEKTNTTAYTPSGDYNPATKKYVDDGLSGKQDTLVSGTNIKTVNNASILGEGNINIDSLPAQSGNSGKFLTTDGTDASWATVDALPAQSGNAGKFLTTDGTDASWATISIPTSISDLTDDTATYPVDKADTLTGLTADVAELNILDGVTATTTEINYVDGVTSNIQTQLDNKLAAKPDGTNNLIDNNKVTTTYLPDFILGQMVYAGTFVPTTAVATLTTNAKTKLGTSSNTITLTNDTTAITGYEANEGCYYICSADGTFAGISCITGDWLVSTGTAWDKIDNTDAVTGVKGNAEVNYRTGNVNITADDVLPTQASNSGKFLTTDGTNASWGTVPVPTKISDLTDDTATYPVDKADTLTNLTATVAELNYVNGVTSAIQTQINGKQDKLTQVAPITITQETENGVTYNKISVAYDNNTIKVNSSGQLYADVTIINGGTV